MIRNPYSRAPEAVSGKSQLSSSLSDGSIPMQIAECFETASLSRIENLATDHCLSLTRIFLQWLHFELALTNHLE